MKVLYLYTELLGYNLPIFEKLVNDYGATVDVIHWSQNKLTPFLPSAHTDSTKITFHDRSAFTAKEIVDFVTELSPDLVYVTGWMDRGYFPALRKLKSMGITIVAGLDSQWTGSVRQHIGAMLIRWVYKKLFYSYVWVPGPLQYEYARRIGFKKTEIICNLLSGNSALFCQASHALDNEKRTNYPQTFLYVGRFAESKGIDILIKAFDIYKEQYKGTWKLNCIGNGPMFDDLMRAAKRHDDMTVESFLPQPELVNRAKAAGAFILPSRYEPWGVVAHEFATAGLPLIFSEKVGARPQFLIDQLNGYTFYDESPEDLAYQMFLMSSHSIETLLHMGRMSAHLASQITPEITTASLMSVSAKKTRSSQHKCNNKSCT
jgi:glycosyltransferase involved in cell wall biosynthesis